MVRRSRNCNILTKVTKGDGEEGVTAPLVAFVRDRISFTHHVTRMLVSHSKYLLVLEESQPQSGSRPCHIIQMLHCLVVSQQDDREQSSASPGLAEAEVNLAVDSLRPLYTGSMCDRDRVLLRVLYLLNVLYPEYTPSLAAMVVKGGGAPARRAEYASEWIFQALGPTAVYASLADFPLWRSVVPQPLCSRAATA